jgi:hypothetical protein
LTASIVAAEQDQAAEAIRIAVRRARRDPIWFRRCVLQLSNDPWQDEVLEAFIDIFRFQANEPTKVNHEGLRRFSVRSGYLLLLTKCVPK